MKTILNLCFVAIFSITAVSCTKNQISLNGTTNTAASKDPVISSKIYTQTNNPSPAEFGQPSAVFNTGDQVVIYLPYAIGNEVIQSAKLTMTDANSEEQLGVFDLLPSTDPSLAAFTVPKALQYVPFRFTVINLGASFSGRTVSVATIINGQSATSSDILARAFSVQ